MEAAAGARSRPKTGTRAPQVQKNVVNKLIDKIKSI
jgi:hypothetical protein